MTIVHITWSFSFGGIETMLVNIANEQIFAGHDIHIVIIDSDKVDHSLIQSFNTNVIKHYINRKFGALDVFAYLRLNKVLLSIKPNTIHLHSATVYKYLLPRFKRICNNTLHALCNPSNTNCIKYIPRVFSISEAVANDLLRKEGVISIVNPNGIRPELIKSKLVYNTPDFYKIVQVGRLDHKNKGQDILIYAGQKLIERGYKNFKIDLVGEGASYEFLKSLVQKLGMDRYVNFVGAKGQKYIFEHLCDYDLLIQPSRLDGFGNTVAEAMAAKLPVVVSSGQGPEEIVGHGEYGYVFQNGDCSDLADKIELFIKGGRDQLMIEKAYKKVWELYNIKVTVKTYIDNYIRI